MQKMNAIEIVEQAERVFRQNRHLFMADFTRRLRELGRPATTCRGTVGFWADPGPRLGWVALSMYCSPSSRHPDEPLILRVHVNDTGERLSARVLRDLNLHPQPHSVTEPSGRDRIELSALPEELAVLAPWVAEWVVARTTPGAKLSAPPVSIPGYASPDFLRLPYEWTAAAEARHEEWINKERQRRERRRLLRNRTKHQGEDRPQP
jgi:hypothetical protein